MDLLEISCSEIRAFELEINRLKDLDFPYDHSRDALTAIEQIFIEHSKTLAGLDNQNNPTTIRTACDRAKEAIYEYMPLLGFIIRSTNLRNAFEAYAPLLRLTRMLLGEGIKLIVSSEWDNGPPFVYRVPFLKDYVFIGLPAQESSNPFLIPLAGHELGHTLWSKSRFASSSFNQTIETLVTDLVEKRWSDFKSLFPDMDGFKVTDPAWKRDLLVLQNLNPATRFAVRQAQETFCDFIGLGLFSEAYLCANAYILSSNLSVERSVFYPNSLVRISNIIKASGVFGVIVPADYEKTFSDREEPKDARLKFWCSLADAVLSRVADDLLAEAVRLLKEKGMPVRTKAKVEEICNNDFRFAVPARDADNLSNILNAAWNTYHNKAIWEKLDNVQNNKDVLAEVVLKSIEVLEVEKLVLRVL